MRLQCFMRLFLRFGVYVCRLLLFGDRLQKRIKMTTTYSVTIGHLFDFMIVAATDKDLGPVVRSVDNAIHRINRYPADKCWQNKLRYPLDSDLSDG